MLNVFETFCFFAFRAPGFRLRFSIALPFALFSLFVGGPGLSLHFLFLVPPSCSVLSRLSGLRLHFYILNIADLLCF